MDSQQVSKSVWRMDMDLQSVVRAWPASTTLLCVFVVLQLLRNKKDKEAQVAPRPIMSMAMLVALSLGCVALDLILSHWVLVLVTFVYMFS
ncbi:unnamed protein product [Urochloa decumbens]|uniref:Uncharacterized protein n=1 Tax=Urochloa decumbens TaxID=240449 RepID=A0ABC8ZNG6_9POAL